MHVYTLIKRPMLYFNVVFLKANAEAPVISGTCKSIVCDALNSSVDVTLTLVVSLVMITCRQTDRQTERDGRTFILIDRQTAYWCLMELVRIGLHNFNITFCQYRIIFEEVTVVSGNAFNV